MKRIAFFAAVAVASNSALGQLPVVHANLDFVSTYHAIVQGNSSLRLYNPLGHVSMLALWADVGLGFRAYASERLQRIPGDPDRDPFYAYYLEDPGIWRIGKQVLPFGQGHILREVGLAARAESSLVLETVPVVIAVCDNGPGRQSGVIGRIGRKFLGLSFAVGRHFGISSESLDLIRLPENSPGIGRGWQRAFGVDALGSIRPFQVGMEFASLSQGETNRDQSMNVLDLYGILPLKTGRFTVGWTEDWPAGLNFVRLGLDLKVSRNVAFSPWVRYLDGKVDDAWLSVKFKL